jgi:hypothetical protein
MRAYEKIDIMKIPKEPFQLSTSQEIEAFDVFGETVEERLTALASSMDELNEKSNLLEYEWVFDREEWYLYEDARYGRCRLVSVTYSDDGTYTVVAAKAWEEDRELLTSGQVTPTQYVRNVSPKARVAHFSQAASRKLDQEMGELSARFRSGDEPEDVNLYVYLYEAAFDRTFGVAGIQTPDIDVYDESLLFYSQTDRIDVIRQAVELRTLRLNDVRSPAWKWGMYGKNPTEKAYADGIKNIQESNNLPDLSSYKLKYGSYNELLSHVKREMSRLWNERFNIDTMFFISPGELDPELAGLYQTRFEQVIKEVEQMYADRGYDPTLYQRDVYKSARIRILDMEFESARETHAKPIVWSRQETIEALMHVFDDIGVMAEETVDNSLLVQSLYGEMPAAIEPLYRKMSEIGIKNTMATSDRALVSRFVVLPKKLTVKNNGEIVTTEQPKTMREWVETINEWSMEESEGFNYLYYIHQKPDGSTLYAELRISLGDDARDANEYAKARSEKVLLANFYPSAIKYLRKYHARDDLQASDFHGAIHIKHFRDRPLNDGIHKHIEFVHNA